MKKHISFAIDQRIKDIAKLPQPAKNYIPQWYKDMDLLTTLDNNVKSYRHMSPKACIPFKDSLMSGYIFELWTDIEILQSENNNINFNWADANIPDILDIRNNKELSDIPTRPNYFPPVFSIYNPLYIKTPPGYSVLITSPINSLDTPLEIMTGIVDTDIYPMYPGRVPFIFPLEFSGVIKSGTPIMQIIPFKRDSWKSKEDNSLIQIAEKARQKFNSVFFGGYRNGAWTKKDFS